MRIINFILFLIPTLNAIATKYDAVDTTAYPDIKITLWDVPNCGLKKPGDQVDPLHSGELFDTLPIAVNYVTSMNVTSYWLSRDLINDERLDWSECADTASCESVGDIKGQCTKFLLRTSPDSNGNALFANTCYFLAPSAHVSHCSRKE